MRKILTVIGLVAALYTPVVMAETSQEQVVAEQSCGASQMWLPPGSNVIANGDALEIQAPAGWYYIGQDDFWESSPMDDMSCSCDCLSTTGTCSPSIINGLCSCTADKCDKCLLTTSGSQAVMNGSGVEVTGPEVAVHRGGYINLDVGVRFATPEDGDLPLVFPDMFKLASIVAALEEFFDTSNLGPSGGIPEMIQQGDHFRAPEGFALAKINVFGRGGLVLVPSPWPEGPANLMVAASRGGSCSCTSGTCTYDTKWTPVGTLYYCSGNCSGVCKLTLGSIAHVETEISRTGQ